MSSKKTEIQSINLGNIEFAEITLTDRNGKEVAKIEFQRDVEATPQLQISYYAQDSNVKHSTTTYDVDA